MTKLLIEEGASSREVELPAAATVIGRAESAEIRVEEPRASREHARIQPVPGGAIVTDLGSLNGTFGEEDRILRTRLRFGDRFRIGETWFTIRAEAPAAARRPGRRVRASLAAALMPAAVLFVLVLAGMHALAANREDTLARARERLALAEYRIAAGPSDPAERLASLRAYRDAWPESTWAARAVEEIGELAPRLARREEAKGALEELDRLRDQDALPFSELLYRYEKLLDRYADVDGTSDRIRRSLHELYDAHEEALGQMVDDVRRQALDLAGREEFGRAASLLTSFVARNPVAASSRERTLREAEAEVMQEALFAYRNVLSRADALIEEGREEDAITLLREQASSFNGTRFLAFLRLRADRLSGRRSGEGAPREKEDLLALRRSYYLLAQEAEELAGASLFGRAADKYANILETVRIPSIREEFAAREVELRSLADLLVRLKATIVEKGEKFGSVRLGGAWFRVTGLEDDLVLFSRGNQVVKRPWRSLDPEEMLALLTASKPGPEDRLLVAVYCFDLNLTEEFNAWILAALEDDDLREAAGRLFARKEGREYPEGGFVAYKGRILTREEHAEEIHREQVAKLRDRQSSLYEKLRGQPVFAKKLAKIVALRDQLDAAREHALSLIFDEVKYFYPYRDRMAEYEIVQREVDHRVDAVREIWDDPTTVALKTDSTVKSILADIAETNDELHALGVGTAEFDRSVEALTRYLDLRLTVRDYYRDEGEKRRFEYDRKVMELNATQESVATELEARQVKITNEYRIMMGRRALYRDDRLVKTARGHSEEMSREGYFSHFSPHPERRTPDLRAKLEGYVASAVSENIHRGSGAPEGAHRGWLHSSGHHRNILQRFWTEMGTGQSGRYWTQNFGRTHLREFPATEEGK